MISWPKLKIPLWPEMLTAPRQVRTSLMCFLNLPLIWRSTCRFAGLDALMQVISCEQDIGWRPDVRRIVFMITDEEPHYAFDGQLAGNRRKGVPAYCMAPVSSMGKIYMIKKVFRMHFEWLRTCGKIKLLRNIEHYSHSQGCWCQMMASAIWNHIAEARWWRRGTRLPWKWTTLLLDKSGNLRYPGHLNLKNLIVSHSLIVIILTF